MPDSSNKCQRCGNIGNRTPCICRIGFNTVDFWILVEGSDRLPIKHSQHARQIYIPASYFSYLFHSQPMAEEALEALKQQGEYGIKVRKIQMMLPNWED
jgi:hypothetical protein